MRIGYLASRAIIFANVIGIILCIVTFTWIYITHVNLTPEKTERVFHQNIAEANKIHSLESFRQVHQSILLEHKRNMDIHYENVRPIAWLVIVILAVFVINTFLFWQLIRERSIRIR